jgi:RND family efflux transporter MFP subunit
VNPTRSLALPLLSLLAATPLAAQGPPPSPVQVDPVRSETLQQRRLVNGELRAARTSLVAGEEAGRVIALEVEDGQRVAAGDVLARLDAARLELDLAVLAAEAVVAQATLAERESALAQVERDLATIERLVERDAANPKELADAETAVVGARARRDQAAGQIAVLEARAALLRDRIADTTIRAPFAGLVAARHVELGQWLVPGGTVVELVSVDVLDAWLEVPQRFLAPVLAQRGPLAVQLSDGSALTAVAWRTVQLVDPAARTFAIVARMPEGAALAPGMSLSAWVPTGAEAEQLTVGADALLRNDAGTFLYVAAPAGDGAGSVATPVQVEVRFRVGERAVVTSPRLAAGALAIVEGNERLYPMAPVQPLSPSGGR